MSFTASAILDVYQKLHLSKSRLFVFMKCCWKPWFFHLLDIIASLDAILDAMVEFK